MSSLRRHVVRSGLRYGVGVQALASANSLTTRSYVYVGQRLVIPGRARLVSAGKSVLLRVPVLGQEHSLDVRGSTARMVAAYLGKPATEAWLQAQLWNDDNPHKGFRGNVDAPFGGMVNYGVLCRAVRPALRVAWD